jgi:hypothetical protein
MKNRLIITAAGCAGIIIWFIMFGMGLFINSKPFRDALAAELNWRPFWNCLMTYTPTNIAALCLLGAFCGGCMSYLLFQKKNPVAEADTADKNKSEAIIESAPQNPFVSMIRGFVVYVAFLGGMYIGADSPFKETSPEQYARAAGAVSLFAFIIGFDQNTFRKFLFTGTKSKE